MLTMLLKSITLGLLALVAVNAQPGPPGVPPRQQQFQQQPPPPNQQQQFQQQQQQQFQQQQQNVQEGHGHGHGGNKLKFQSEIHNADHIIEHLQDQIKTKPKEQMSEEELEFHYFKMHDYDNNNKLDGVEIGKALTHFHDEHEEGSAAEDDEAGTMKGGPGGVPEDVVTGQPQADDHDGESVQYTGRVAQEREFIDDTIEYLVDEFLRNYDRDDDGYVEYFEFRKAKDKSSEN